MFGLMEHALNQLKGAFPGSEYSVEFSVENHPLIAKSKAITLRAPSVAMNNRLQGLYTIGILSDHYDGLLEARSTHINVILAVRTTTLSYSGIIGALDDIDDMLHKVRTLFDPPLCLAFLNPIAAVTSTDDTRYGYMTGHNHEFHISNITETEPGWWAESKFKNRVELHKALKAGEYAQEGIKLDLSVGPFIQYIDSSSGE